MSYGQMIQFINIQKDKYFTLLIKAEALVISIYQEYIKVREY
ncbi:hypothetical protein RINTHH_4590 [Richelia intracellularis HH01]|uniref:Uncharacterized protein n=1 Tax=Richelia intracellularis HH01 TaxID=1165094 RepID=M1WQW8_9NOST|nr:hypothetical protein RINTHH_4590 [Richelia intracellularis HH01]